VARRIGGAGGGSDPGNKGSGVVVAISVALVISAGGASVGATASSSSASGGSGGASRSSMRASSQDSAAAQARLASRGVRITARLTDDSNDCAGHSYGQVQQFFRDHPCTKLHRAQFEVRDSKGDVVLVPVAWVAMPTDDDAEALKQLLDQGGTGNVKELSRERGRYRAVRYTGDAYASRRDGTVVANAQAQPVARGWTGLTLTTIATNAVQ
jgi:hypothetical protein